MDTQKYISSGILELYVLDELSLKERSEVAAYAAEYPEIGKEIAAIEDALYLYSLQRAVPPPPSLEGAILKKIDQISPKGGASSNSASGGGATPPRSPGWLIPILSVLLIGALGWGAWLFSDNSNQEEELSTLNEKLVVQEQECETIENDNKILEEQLRLIRTASNRVIRMKGTDKAPDAIATVYWNEDAQKTYLDVNNMPAPPSDKQYQLWAIVDGTPVDMGVFDLDITVAALQEVPHVANAQAFAVTLEPKGGSVAPTLTEMYVIGEVG